MSKFALKFAFISLAVVLLLQLSGCAYLIYEGLPRDGKRLNADPPDVLAESGSTAKVTDAKTRCDTYLNGAPNDKNYKGCVYNAAMDSLRKCQKFQNQLYYNLQEINTTGDIVSAFFSTAATLAKPITTIHALTASSGFTTGMKSSIDADVFANASVVNFNMAINTTYGSAITNYIAAVHGTDTIDPIDLQYWLVTLEQVHQMCSIASAETAIGSALTPAAANNAASPISASLQFKDAGIFVDDPTQLTISLGNSSDKKATLTKDFTHDLAAKGLKAAMDTTVSGTCLQGAKIDGASSVITLPSKSTIDSKGCTIVVNVTADEAATVNDSIAAKDLVTDIGSNAASDVASIQVQTKPELTAEGSTVSATLIFENPVIYTGASTLLTITLNNTGQKTATLNKDFKHDLSKFGLKAVAPVTGSCKTASIDAASVITFAKKSTIPAGGCTIKVSVTSNKAKTVIDQIDADVLATTGGNNKEPQKATLEIKTAPVINGAAIKNQALDRIVSPQPTPLIEYFKSNSLK